MRKATGLYGPALNGQSVQAKGVGGSGSGARLAPRRIATAGQYSCADRTCCSPFGDRPNSAIAFRERQPIASMHLNVPSHGFGCESLDSAVISMQSSVIWDVAAEDEATGRAAAIAVAWPAKPSRAANSSKAWSARVATLVG